ncbi:MAG: hypothetical protein AAFX79_13560 [Planctomycetota bacterium]
MHSSWIYTNLDSDGVALAVLAEPEADGLMARRTPPRLARPTTSIAVVTLLVVFASLCVNSLSLAIAYDARESTGRYAEEGLRLAQEQHGFLVRIVTDREFRDAVRQPDGAEDREASARRANEGVKLAVRLYRDDNANPYARTRLRVCLNHLADRQKQLNNRDAEKALFGLAGNVLLGVARFFDEEVMLVIDEGYNAANAAGSVLKDEIDREDPAKRDAAIKLIQRHIDAIVPIRNAAQNPWDRSVAAGAQLALLISRLEAPTSEAELEEIRAEIVDIVENDLIIGTTHHTRVDIEATLEKLEHKVP